MLAGLRVRAKKEDPKEHNPWLNWPALCTPSNIRMVESHSGTRTTSGLDKPEKL